MTGRPLAGRARRAAPRALDVALVLAAAALYLAWVSHGDLTGTLPGGSTVAYAVLGGLVAALAVARLAATGALARLRVAARADPAPWLLATIVLAALALRLAPLAPPAAPDLARERAALAATQHILTTGDFTPPTFAVPSLLLYLQTAAGSAAFLLGVSAGRWQEVGALHPADLAASARLLNALLGALTVALVYVAGRRLYGRRAGLLAALLLAVSPLAWLAARAATGDALATLAGIAAFLVGVGSRESAVGSTGFRRPPRSTTARPVLPSAVCRPPSAVLLGVAAGVRPALALLAVPLLIVALTRRPRPPAWGWGLLAGGMVVGYLIAVPYALAGLPGWLDAGAAAAREYDLRVAPGTLGLLVRQIPAALLLLARQDPLTALVGGAGALLALARRGRPDLLLLAFLVPSGALLLLHRDLLAWQFAPYVPFLALLGGTALDAGWTLLAGGMRPRRTRPARRPAGATATRS
ncbi:MAG TPA: glycosyltransferase family 39 protein [Thermomicrobiales bacterium]|nr:glycosyltransferase family 39 protein [Thermomicrobiales bacterium]